MGLLDYHDEVPPEVTPDPGVPVPAPTPDPMPDAGVVPMPGSGVTPVTIAIVGTFGTAAFSPNPTQAAVGDMLVWTNSDIRNHFIVLDDGTVVGDVAPGASSAPTPLMSAAATYRCTLHPSMVGTISSMVASEPLPPGAEPLPAPALPSPGYETPPADDPPSYGYRR